MTKKELENKIGDLEKQLVELKEELERKDNKIPVGEIWKPKKSGKYYFNSSVGISHHELNYFRACDLQIMDSGNCYPTKEKAEFEANREKYTRLFRQYVEQHSEPLDCNNGIQNKHFVFYDHEEQKIDIWFTHMCCCLGGIYASSKEVLKEAIDFVGEENVKKYILEIGE